MKTLFTFLLISCFTGFCTNSQTPKQPEVYLIPVLHGLHKVNAHYSYESLIRIIDSLNPDVIAVEIRPEDIMEDTLYLKNNYPKEMWMMPYWFPGKELAGIDWLGEDIEEKPIPPNYWSEISAVKKNERLLAADSLYLNRMKACQSFQEERMPLLRNLSLQELLKSNESALTLQQYACYDEVLKGSPFEAINAFYLKRNEKLLKNIKSLVSANKDKRIVILIGADHYAWLKDKFAHTPLY